MCEYNENENSVRNQKCFSWPKNENCCESAAHRVYRNDWTRCVLNDNQTITELRSLRRYSFVDRYDSVHGCALCTVFFLRSLTLSLTVSFCVNVCRVCQFQATTQAEYSKAYVRSRATLRFIYSWWFDSIFAMCSQIYCEVNIQKYTKF